MSSNFCDNITRIVWDWFLVVPHLLIIVNLFEYNNCKYIVDDF